MIFTISIWSDETDWRRNKIQVQECKRFRKDEYDREIYSIYVCVRVASMWILERDATWFRLLDKILFLFDVDYIIMRMCLC